MEKDPYLVQPRKGGGKYEVVVFSFNYSFTCVCQWISVSLRKTLHNKSQD